MHYLEEKILYIDIGAAFLKALLIKFNWIGEAKVVLNHKIPSIGINANGIENFQLFNNNINKLIYEIEYKTSIKIYKVIIIYGCFFTNYLSNTATVSLTAPINDGDLSRLNRNQLSNINNKIIHYNYYFIIDHYLYTLNPLGMLGKFLTVKQNYLLMNNTLYENINYIFKRNHYEVTNNFHTIYVLCEYIRSFHNNFIIIDGGYYTTRVCLVENNMLKEFYTINTGIYNLLQNISLKYQLSIEEAYGIVCKEGLLAGENEEIIRTNQSFLNNIFQKCLQLFKSSTLNNIDIPIFLNGWNFLNPAEYYLKIKYNRDIYGVSTYFNWPPQFEYLYAIFNLKNKEESKK
jgi:cell division ATPase FtsA